MSDVVLPAVAKRSCVILRCGISVLLVLSVHAGLSVDERSAEERREERRLD